MSPGPIRLEAPLSIEDIEPLRSGDVVRLSGVLYTARDAAHARMKEAIEAGEPNPDPELATLERELLDSINATGIGPAGYGGTQTALAVHVESFPTHIAAFPVAVNLDCHSHRTASAEL